MNEELVENWWAESEPPRLYVQIPSDAANREVRTDMMIDDLLTLDGSDATMVDHDPNGVITYRVSFDG